METEQVSTWKKTLQFQWLDRSMKALLVDDEQLARFELRRLLRWLILNLNWIDSTHLSILSRS